MASPLIKLPSVEQQAAAFVDANDLSSVVARGYIYRSEGSVRIGKLYGQEFRLKDSSKHQLPTAAIDLLPDSYPRWDLNS